MSESSYERSVYEDLMDTYYDHVTSNHINHGLVMNEIKNQFDGSEDLDPFDYEEYYSDDYDTTWACHRPCDGCDVCDCFEVDE